MQAKPKVTRTLNTTLQASLWSVLVISYWVASLWIAWLLLKSADFGYPLWHQQLNIDHFIQVYGPRNDYKDDFALTTPEEQFRLFSEIVEAVHQQGQGLEAITYHNADGHVIDQLLRPPEIIHLIDVSHLITQFSYAGWISIALSIGLSLLQWFRQQRFPKWQYIGAGCLIIMSFMGFLLWFFGPTRVFYQLHIWIFPPQHQWFFYYEESLMTTLMHAPQLFGYIGASWLITAIAAWGVILWVLRTYLFESAPIKSK